MNENSIMYSIKSLLGLSDDPSFDGDIITYINNAFVSLNQIGAGPPTGFSIIDDEPVWHDFSINEALLSVEASVKTYVYISVKLILDPPSTQALLDALKQTKSEAEWRINVAVDNI